MAQEKCMGGGGYAMLQTCMVIGAATIPRSGGACIAQAGGGFKVDGLVYQGRGVF